MANKKWLWIAPLLAITVLIGAPRIAGAYKAWQIIERRAAIDRAKAALQQGADGLPELTALLAGDPDADPAAPEVDGDDAEVLDSVPLSAAANPGAWQAWRTYRGNAEEAQQGWNWEGVWEERVRKGVEGSLAEPVLFGGAGSGGGEELVSDVIPCLLALLGKKTYD